jgi:hypothetical protein
MIKLKDFDFNEWQANPSLRIFTDEGSEVFHLKYCPTYAHQDQLHGIMLYGRRLREESWDKDGKFWADDFMPVSYILKMENKS